jgi:tRNA threonylcarbamoyladenosine biosynthesis protein TsaB
MNILSLDGSNNNLSIAIQKNDQLVINDIFLNSKNQSEKLVSLIDENLKKSNLEYSDLDFVAIANGPANFTGIRIQFTIAKIINLVAKIPIVTVGTLEAFAYEYKNQSNKIIALIDAKLGEFFIQEFEVVNQNLIAKYPAKLIKKENILNIFPQDEFLLVGNSDIECHNANYSQKSSLIKCQNIIYLAKKKYSKNNFSFEELSYMREPSISKRK